MPRKKKKRTEYKKVIDRHNKTGMGRKTKFYDQLNDILAHKPATRPEIVLDTSLSTESSSVDSSENTTGVLDSSGGLDCSDTNKSCNHPQELSSTDECGKDHKNGT